uniref:Endonuclease/exonuclease/phosphatase domain-containing protein n=1 Tax=Sphaeramia orbicularis TaxID=375764 RepID=A0A673CDH9_9TELE
MEYNSLKILSLNINGLNSPAKRGKVMTKLKKEKIQIIFLQETHLSKAEHEKLQKCGYRNSYDSLDKQGNRRGVIILISILTKLLYEKEIQDKEGRYVIVKGNGVGNHIYLVHILLVACKKVLTRNWLKTEPPTKDQWITITEGMYTMENITDKLQLQEAQKDKKWNKWTDYRTQNGRTE